MNVQQLIVELSEYDLQAPVKVQGEGDIVDIETTDTNIILISGDYNGVE